MLPGKNADITGLNASRSASISVSPAPPMASMSILSDLQKMLQQGTNMEELQAWVTIQMQQQQQQQGSMHCPLPRPPSSVIHDVPLMEVASFDDENTNLPYFVATSTIGGVTDRSFGTPSRGHTTTSGGGPIFDAKHHHHHRPNTNSAPHPHAGSGSPLSMLQAGGGGGGGAVSPKPASSLPASTSMMVMGSAAAATGALATVLPPVICSTTAHQATTTCANVTASSGATTALSGVATMVPPDLIDVDSVRRLSEEVAITCFQASASPLSAAAGGGVGSPIKAGGTSLTTAMALGIDREDLKGINAMLGGSFSRAVDRYSSSHTNAAVVNQSHSGLLDGSPLLQRTAASHSVASMNASATNYLPGTLLQAGGRQHQQQRASGDTYWEEACDTQLQQLSGTPRSMHAAAAAADEAVSQSSEHLSVPQYQRSRTGVTTISPRLPLCCSASSIAESRSNSMSMGGGDADSVRPPWMLPIRTTRMDMSNSSAAFALFNNTLNPSAAGKGGNSSAHYLRNASRYPQNNNNSNFFFPMWFGGVAAGGCAMATSNNSSSSSFSMAASSRLSAIDLERSFNVQGSASGMHISNSDGFFAEALAAPKTVGLDADYVSHRNYYYGYDEEDGGGATVNVPGTNSSNHINGQGDLRTKSSVDGEHGGGGAGDWASIEAMTAADMNDCNATAPPYSGPRFARLFSRHTPAYVNPVAVEAHVTSLGLPFIKSIDDPAVCVFDILESNGKKLFIVVCMNVLLRYHFFHRFGFDARKLLHLVTDLDSYMHTSSPFGNYVHAAEVVLAAHQWARQRSAALNLSDEELFAFLMSSVVMRVAHTGVDNCFLTHIKHPFALQGNFISPQQGISLALVFALLSKPENHFMPCVTVSKPPFTDAAETTESLVSTTKFAEGDTAKQRTRLSTFEVNPDGDTPVPTLSAAALAAGIPCRCPVDPSQQAGHQWTQGREAQFYDILAELVMATDERNHQFLYHELERICEENYRAHGCSCGAARQSNLPCFECCSYVTDAHVPALLKSVLHFICYSYFFRGYKIFLTGMLLASATRYRMSEYQALLLRDADALAMPVPMLAKSSPTSTTAKTTPTGENVCVKRVVNLQDHRSSAAVATAPPCISVAPNCTSYDDVKASPIATTPVLTEVGYSESDRGAEEDDSGELDPFAVDGGSGGVSAAQYAEATGLFLESTSAWRGNAVRRSTLAMVNAMADAPMAVLHGRYDAGSGGSSGGKKRAAAAVAIGPAAAAAIPEASKHQQQRLSADGSSKTPLELSLETASQKKSGATKEMSRPQPLRGLGRDIMIVILEDLYVPFMRLIAPYLPYCWVVSFAQNRERYFSELPSPDEYDAIVEKLRYASTSADVSVSVTGTVVEREIPFELLREYCPISPQWVYNAGGQERRVLDVIQAYAANAILIPSE